MGSLISVLVTQRRKVKTLKRRLVSRWRRLIFRPHIFKVCAEGENFSFYVGSYVGQQWYELEDHNSWPEMAFIRDHLIRSGGLVVECGSHHGFTTVLLSKWVGTKGKVIAFEANPRNASIAIKNLEINKIKNVEFHAKAVGSQTGKIWITDESNAQVAASFRRGRVEVPAVRLDDLFADHIPDLIKIDVEGYELEVIRGLRSTLARKATRLAIEVHCNALKNYGSSTLELFEIIGLEDYDCWLGTGDEAKAGIKPFIIGQDEVPSLWRIYLFAVPKGTVFFAR